LLTSRRANFYDGDSFLFAGKTFSIFNSLMKKPFVRILNASMKNSSLIFPLIMEMSKCELQNFSKNFDDEGLTIQEAEATVESFQSQ